MSRLVITGNKKQLETIARRTRLQAKRYGLKISLENESQDSIINKMKEAKTIDDLKLFASDTRAKVSKFYKKMVEKLNSDNETQD